MVIDLQSTVIDEIDIDRKRTILFGFTETGMAGNSLGFKHSEQRKKDLRW
jgi:hypothetical protein